MPPDQDVDDYLRIARPAWLAALAANRPPATDPKVRLSSFDYFAHQSQPNALFNELGRLAIRATLQALHDSDATLDSGVRLAHEWMTDREGRSLHMGTPYYFAGMRDILAGNLDRGFGFMHQALAADLALTGEPNPDWPAWKFVTMNADSREQAFFDEVLTYATFIEARFTAYQASRRGELTLSLLRSRVLAHPNLRDLMFHLTFAVARLTRLHSNRRHLAGTDFSRLVTDQLAFDLCLLTDQALQTWDGTGEWRMYHLATRYLRAAKLNIEQVDLDDARTRFDRDPTATLAALLDGTYRTRGSPPEPRSIDLLLLYGIRNFLAHGGARSRTLDARFDEVEPHLFYVLFAVLEHVNWPDPHTSVG
jgi:hypothetical protein